MSDTPNTTPTDAHDLPDCGHKEWTLGCERCFFETKALAQRNLQVDQSAMDDATFRGASLFAWHIALVLASTIRQAAEMSSSLDLQKAHSARILYYNLKQLEDHITGLMADPPRMEAALRQAADIAVASHQAVQQQAAAPEPTPPASAIVLTD